MKYGYLYLPGLIILLIPCIKAFIDAHKEKAEMKRKIAAKESREAARREAIRQHNADIAAAKEAKKAPNDAVPKRKPGRPRKMQPPIDHYGDNSPASEPADEPPEAPAESPIKIITRCGNNAFLGQSVSFTGTLPGMTRSEAIKAVQENGGKAFDAMPASTTLLVVGSKPGTRKLDKADEWPSCKKITPEQFFIMLHQPLTFEPDDFASFLGAWLANNNA